MPAVIKSKIPVVPEGWKAPFVLLLAITGSKLAIIGTSFSFVSLLMKLYTSRLLCVWF